MYKSCKQCGDIFFCDQEWKKICIECWKKNKNISTDKSQQSSICIDSEMLKILIRLCHPDKHGNNEMSNKATSYLLSLRKN